MKRNKILVRKHPAYDDPLKLFTKDIDQFCITIPCSCSAIMYLGDIVESLFFEIRKNLIALFLKYAFLPQSITKFCIDCNLGSIEFASSWGKREILRMNEPLKNELPLVSAGICEEEKEFSSCSRFPPYLTRYISTVGVIVLRKKSTDALNSGKEVGSGFLCCMNIRNI